MATIIPKVNMTRLNISVIEPDSTPKERPERMAGALIPLATALGPPISTFVTKLISPLIKGVAQGNSDSEYKNELIKKFASRTFSGTRFQDSEAKRAFDSNIENKQYTVALSNLRSNQQPMDIDQLYPINDLG